MRSPGRKRPMVRKIDAAPNQAQLEAAARRAIYVGSPEHKTEPSFAGQPRPRADASMCEPQLVGKQQKIIRWLRTAIRRGNVSSYWELGFPRYVWTQQNNCVYEARLTNAELGQYKGYPLAADEAPEGMHT